MRVGVEVGGTFTDLVAVEDGHVVVTKVPSTPRSPDVGAFEALTASGIDLSRIEDLGHGSTVATNAVLERKGASVAFIATAGFREFERASTTLLSAYVQPVIDGYLHRFENKLAGAGFKGRFTVMQSNGGRLPAEAMRTSAITALYSGPAAGVVGATRQAARSGFKDLITFDMGGTSTDVCLVQDGRPSLATESEIDGLPIRTPVLDIVSVGAGGGSIVCVDDGGLPRVGRLSAGADPGPACYGKGGSEPAITDAHIVIGTIRPGAFLGGRMELDGAAARRVFAPLAARFGLSVEQAASSALQPADANVVPAI